VRILALLRHRRHGVLAATAAVALAGAGYAATQLSHPRDTAAVVLAALMLVWLVALAVLVPWRRPAAPRADQRAALADLPAEHVARGKQLSARLRPWGYAGFAVNLAATVALALTPWGAAVVDAAAGPFGGHWIAQAVLGSLAIMFGLHLLTLPIAARVEVIRRRYSLSTQTWPRWTVDLLKASAIGAVIGGVVMLGFYTAGRFSPHWWWAWAAAGSATVVVLLTFVFPVLIAPVFNKFTPLPDGPLRRRLLALAAADGVAVRDVQVADASRRTTALNAYVAGLGPTRQVVIFDTLLRPDTAGQDSPPVMSQTRLTGATDDQIVSVVAHELAHRKFSDLPTQLAIAVPSAAAVMSGLYLLDGWTALLDRAGAASFAEPHSVALRILVTALLGLLLGPLKALVSRRFEARADHHALQATGDADAFESMWRRIVEVNIADVHPHLIARLSASHPSIVERIAAARAYARTTAAVAAQHPPVNAGARQTAAG
jgi:STE24 endopeptidase